MKPLLRIHSVPIEMTYTTTRAKLSHNFRAPQIQAKQLSREFSQQKLPDPRDVQIAVNQNPQYEFPQVNSTAAVDAAVNYSTSNAVSVDFSGNTLPAVQVNPMSKVLTNHEAIMSFSSSAPVSVQSSPINFAIATANLNVQSIQNVKPQLEYTPGSLEVTISQYPELIIEYIGEPIYVPLSSNPNYVEPTLLNIKA